MSSLNVGFIIACKANSPKWLWDEFNSKSLEKGKGICFVYVAGEFAVKYYQENGHNITGIAFKDSKVVHILTNIWQGMCMLLF